MIGPYLLQADRGFPVFQFGNKTPMLILLFQYLPTGFEVRIQTRYAFPKIIQRALKEVIRHKKILFHIFLLQSISRFTCQNNKFTDYIFPAQVDTRIRLGIPFLLRHLYRAAKRNIGTDFVEDIIQCTA